MTKRSRETELSMYLKLCVFETHFVFETYSKKICETELDPPKSCVFCVLYGLTAGNANGAQMFAIGPLVFSLLQMVLGCLCSLS